MSCHVQVNHTLFQCCFARITGEKKKNTCIWSANIYAQIKKGKSGAGLCRLYCSTSSCFTCAMPAHVCVCSGSCSCVCLFIYICVRCLASSADNANPVYPPEHRHLHPPFRFIVTPSYIVYMYIHILYYTVYVEIYMYIYFWHTSNGVDETETLLYSGLLILTALPTLSPLVRVFFFFFLKSDPSPSSCLLAAEKK